MNADQFLRAKIELTNEQAKYTEYINEKFAEVANEFLKANCPFIVGNVVEVGARKLTIQHIEPLTWFEFVMIRLYGIYDNGDVEQNGIALNEYIKLSEPCQDKLEV